MDIEISVIANRQNVKGIAQEIITINNKSFQKNLLQSKRISHKDISHVC